MTTINRQDNPRSRIVIIGGGYAGMICALRLARHSRAHIDLVNPQERFVQRIRLHEAASGKKLRVITIPSLLRGKDVTFHQAGAVHIDWRAHKVTLSDGSQLEYDRLVYAVGSQIDRTVVGASEHALNLDGFNGARVIAERLDALPAQSEVIMVGGGLTATELVTELAERYPALHWTLVAREAYEQGFAPAARDYFLQAFARRGIRTHTGVEVKRVEADHIVTSVGDMPFALCLWAASFRGIPLGRESGLAVNEKDQLLVDETLRSLTAPEIYVAGDSAALPARFQPHIIMGCKTALPQGIHAAKNLLAEMDGETPQPLRYSYPGTCVSLGRHDGLYQMLTADGEANETIVRGRLAAVAKELINRVTVLALQAERHFDFADWFLPAKAPNTPVAEPQSVPSQG